MQQKDIMNVRRAVDANIGRRVRVRANKGRHKYSVAEGVIQESYPSIFTVRINADEDNAAYRFRLFAVSSMESEVVIALEFNSYARCAMIIFTISSATCTFEASM